MKGTNATKILKSMITEDVCTNIQSFSIMHYVTCSISYSSKFYLSTWRGVELAQFPSSLAQKFLTIPITGTHDHHGSGLLYALGLSVHVMITMY